jgi:manganese transport protein
MTPPDAGTAILTSDPGSPVAVAPSLPGAFRSVSIPALGYWKKLAAFAGPGYLVAVGYMDPGNWATDIAGGSAFGYALAPAIALSSVVAMFLQWLALRLGIASGLDLAQACRARFPKPVAHLLWATCEIAIIACDLAEVIGTAIALQLLFHLPLLAGVTITAFDTLIIMALQKRGFRYMEALVVTLLCVVGLCFGVELILSRPDGRGLAASFAGAGDILRHPGMLYLALGIFGATVMPHNLYLHSSIAQTRRFERTPRGRREAIHFSTIDSTVALVLALAINAAILILAAAAFHAHGHTRVAEIGDAYRLLSPLLGVGGAGLLFALALLASGQNSTLTGTMAGQIVMEGFLDIRLNPVCRRLLTRGLAIAPALVVIAVAGEGAASRLLIASQVVLSLQLGFAVVPLVLFTSDRKLMGSFANSRAVSLAGYGLAAAIIAVNGWLVLQTAGVWR